MLWLMVSYILYNGVKYLQNLSCTELRKKKIKLKNKKAITTLFKNKEEPFVINKKGYLVIPQYVDFYKDNILEEKKQKTCPAEPGEFVIDLPLDIYY